MVAAADKMDDLQRVAFCQGVLFEFAAWRDGAVAFDRHLGRIEFKLANEIGDGGCTGAAGFAVDGQGKRLGHHPRDIGLNANGAS